MYLLIKLKVTFVPIGAISILLKLASSITIANDSLPPIKPFS